MTTSPPMLAGTPSPAPAGKKSRGEIGNLLALFLFFTITTAPHAMRGFWYDELFSFYMSQMPSNAAVWRALMEGADMNPPLGYFIIRSFQAVFGNSEFVTRAPQMIGYFVMSLCLYRFVSRRGTPLYGYAAAVLPWCSGAYVLATEARPYGLMLAFSALALLCWQEGLEQKRKWWSLPGVTLALACALLSHCYAVLVLIPFGIAEITRAYVSKRADFRMWAAVVLPVTCVAIYLPLMANLKPYVFDSYFFKVPWTALPQVYEYLVGPALIWALAIGGILMAIPGAPATQANQKSIRTCEWAMAFSLAALPAIAVILAKGMSSQFFPRYGSAGILGLGLLFGLFMHWRNTSARVAARVVAVLLVCHACNFAVWLYPLIGDPPTAEKATLEKRERRQSAYDIRKDLPFVVAGGIRFLELDHYGSKELVSRLYYLLDRDTSLEYTQSDIFAKAFPQMQHWFPMRGKLVPYQQFVAEHERFLVYGNYHFPNDWLLKKLIDDGASLSLLTDTESMLGDQMLFEVNWKSSRLTAFKH